MKTPGQNSTLQSQTVLSLLLVAHQESSRTGFVTVLTCSSQHLKQSANLELWLMLMTAVMPDYA